VSSPSGHNHDPADATLEELGFSERFQALFEPMRPDGFVPGRIVRQDRGLPLVALGGEAVRAEPATHLIKAGDPGWRVTIGDWVAVAGVGEHDVGIIEAILPRTSTLSRKDPGESAEEQVMVANLDRIMVVQALAPNPPNVRRLERELVVAWESGAIPVVVLTKADLLDDPEAVASEAREASLGVDVHVVSGLDDTGLEDLKEHVAPGMTTAMFGASGVGKSTLANSLVGAEVQLTTEVREADGKGRHTTVVREMVMMPSGGILVDTPGMRGLGLWEADDGLAQAFPDVIEAALACRFRDCIHEAEPGCGVRAAVEGGELTEHRVQSYLDLRDEFEAVARRREERARGNTKARWKSRSKEIKRLYKDRGQR
jgi:ribosome biogenesis GTPase